MAYVAHDDLLTYFSAQALLKFLDDNGDGEEDTGLFAKIVSGASQAVDGRLATTYQVPFSDPAPAKVKAACLIFVAEAFYKRRNVPPEKNPFFVEAEYWRHQLDAIGVNGHGLDAGASRAVPAAGYYATESDLTDNTR
jgi:hypothetical protein